MVEGITKEEILNQVRTIVAEQLCIDKEKVQPDAAFLVELGADSLDLVELVMALEESFNVEITDQSAGELETVQDAVNYIYKKLKQ
jgi:acyl carrier protein